MWGRNGCLTVKPSCLKTVLMDFLFDWRKQTPIDWKDMKKFRVPRMHSSLFCPPPPPTPPSDNVKTQTTGRLNNVIAWGIAAWVKNINHKTGGGLLKGSWIKGEGQEGILTI